MPAELSVHGRSQSIRTLRRWTPPSYANVPPPWGRSGSTTRRIDAPLNYSPRSRTTAPTLLRLRSWVRPVRVRRAVICSRRWLAVSRRRARARTSSRGPATASQVRRDGRAIV